MPRAEHTDVAGPRRGEAAIVQHTVLQRMLGQNPRSLNSNSRGTDCKIAAPELQERRRRRGLTSFALFASHRFPTMGATSREESEQSKPALGSKIK